MSKLLRLFACALFSVMALLAPAPSSAQSPFDGTWVANLAQSKFSPKPIVFYLSQGWYHCVSCNPTFDVNADGQDHPVAGQAFDSAAVRDVDAKTITIITRKGDKVVSEETMTVSADGKTLTVKSTYHPMNSDKPDTAEVTATRVGIKPSGVHATSGQWQLKKASESANGLTSTYKSNGDELTMTAATGESYTAKFDGNDYPVKGAYGWDTVSLKKIDAHTIEETDKWNGKVTDVAKMTVSADGKKMTVVDTNKLTDRTSTFIADKKK
jgi:hypothetical protein